MNDEVHDDVRFDVVRTATVLTFPIVLIFAGSHIFNAHKLPGEGFSAGLLVALSIALLHVGVGYGQVERDLPRFVRWAMPLGLALALAVGLGGMIAGRAFLAHTFTHVVLWGEELVLSTSSLFDVAVFLSVAGGAHDITRAVCEIEPST